MASSSTRTSVSWGIELVVAEDDDLEDVREMRRGQALSLLIDEEVVAQLESEARSRHAPSLALPQEETEQETEQGKETRMMADDDDDIDSDLAGASAVEAAGEAVCADARDRWDRWHVKLPCSSRNTITRKERVATPLGIEIRTSVTYKWDLIEAALRPVAEGRLRDVAGLEELIKELHPAYRKRWTFDALHFFFTAEASADEAQRFFGETLPAIATLALRLPDLCPDPIPLLLPQKTADVTLSQLQVACLLACAFFSLFPQRNSSPQPAAASASGPVFPAINFSPEFLGITEPAPVKYRFVFNYFQRWASRLAADPFEHHGMITFHRRAAVQQPQWLSSRARLVRVEIRGSTIEDSGSGNFQMDFANKSVGGGIMRRGSAQEEIRFLINPELILARLITAELRPNETLMVVGAERYASYTGYSQTLAYGGDFVDPTQRDAQGRLRTVILAVDATDYSVRNGSDPLMQFQQDAIERELLKCYVGFSTRHPEDQDRQLCPIATGHWGCGAFFGHPQLKLIIQWLAASVVRRPLIFFPFDRPDFIQALEELINSSLSLNITVQQLFQALLYYLDDPTFDPEQIFQHLTQHFSSSMQDG